MAIIIGPMNDSGSALHASLALSVLATRGIPAKLALRVAVLTEAAARFLPTDWAQELARNVLHVVSLREEVGSSFGIRETVEQAIQARRVKREGPGAWLWPDDVDGAAVAEAMSRAWKQVTA
jgi:hypothetical protein